MTAPEKPYRQGVGVVLLNDVGKVFVAQRIDTTEPAWQMPQGGIDKGEDPYAAASR
ncbi:MAG: NUDIX domain-containing protein, partial [Rhodospirillaceae bacterium]|nr:NUDIX domain-containing protein [Rhodospirillaceae bacterium]